MDGIQLIKEIGGGLAAVVIVVQGLVIMRLWKRLNYLEDDRLENAMKMADDLRQLVVDTNAVTSSNTEVSRQVVRTIEDQRREIRLLEDRR